MRTEAAHQNCNNQWATCQTELHGLRHTRNSDRNRAHQHTEENTEEDRNQIWLTQTAHRVAERLSHRLDSHLRTNNGQTVTNLQFEVVLGDQIDTRTVYACYVHRVATAQTQLADGLAVNMRLGDDDSSRDKLLIEINPIRMLHINLVTEHHLDCLDIFVCTDDQHLIAFGQDRIGINNLDRAIYATNTRHNKRAIDQAASFDYRTTKQVGIGQLD